MARKEKRIDRMIFFGIKLDDEVHEYKLLALSLILSEVCHEA